MTNICFFNTTKFWGGGEKWHLETATFLAHNGHQVFFITHPKGELQKRIECLAVTSNPMAVSNLSFLNPYKMRCLVSFFRTHKIQTVVFNSSSDVKLGAVAARLAGVRAIVYRRGIASTVKNTWLNRQLYRRFLTHLLTNSKETARAMLQRLDVPEAAKRVRTIYNGINLSHFTPSKLQSGSSDQSLRKVTIGTAGRLIALKGHRHLIDMASRLKKQNVDFRVLIAGDGPDRDQLQNQIQKRGVDDKVQLLGFVSDMRSFLQQIDIFLFPSLTEGFGYAIVEAMAMERPVVAFNAGSIPEVVEDEHSGFLVPPNDVDALTQKTILLAKDLDLRKRMGNSGKARAKEMFDHMAQLNKLESYLCREVLADNQ